MTFVISDKQIRPRRAHKKEEEKCYILVLRVLVFRGIRVASLVCFFDLTCCKVRAAAHQHAVGLVQQIDFCTWTGPGEDQEREEERGGGADSGREPGGVIEPKRGYLRALECQHGCSHLSQWTDAGPSALWHDFSL